jgi:phosphoribosyl 1,2-cyclic phosphodiesterase
MGIKVKFWGVRGSIACPGTQYVRYGGNTSCIEVSVGGERFILDGGTGVRNLGHWMLKKDVRRATILLSHTHWDHINGLPFFSPAFRKGHSFHVMAGHVSEGQGIAKVFAGQMENPYFPVPVEAMLADISFEDFRAGETLKLGANGSVTVRTAPLNHPNEATAYRFDHQGRSVCYLTDTEHIPGKPDETILGLIEGADLLIYDSTYTDDEFSGKVGWGHSTWQEGVRLAKVANGRQLAIFHHDPDHDDNFMDEVAAQAQEQWQGAFVARENMRLDIDRLADAGT